MIVEAFSHDGLCDLNRISGHIDMALFMIIRYLFYMVLTACFIRKILLAMHLNTPRTGLKKKIILLSCPGKVQIQTL